MKLIIYTEHFSIHHLQIWSERPGGVRDFKVTFSYSCMLFSPMTMNPGSGLFVKWEGFSEPYNGIWNRFCCCWRRNTTRTWAPRVHSFPAARSSALPSPGRSSATPRSCCWTRPPLPWTPRARRYTCANCSPRVSAPKIHICSQCPPAQAAHERPIIFIIILKIIIIYHLRTYPPSSS